MIRPWRPTSAGPAMRTPGGERRRISVPSDVATEYVNPEWPLPCGVILRPREPGTTRSRRDATSTRIRSMIWSMASEPTATGRYNQTIGWQKQYRETAIVAWHDTD